MRRIYVIATLLLGILSAQAQEKVMDIRMADGTSTRTRVADLKQISFLAIETGNQGLLLKTTGGETVAVRFEANPVVTVSKDKLTVKQSEADAMEFEITDIAENTVRRRIQCHGYRRAGRLFVCRAGRQRLAPRHPRRRGASHLLPRRTQPPHPAPRWRQAATEPCHTRQRHLHRKGRLVLCKDKALSANANRLHIANNPYIVNC